MILEHLTIAELSDVQGAVKGLLLANPFAVNPTTNSDGSGGCLYDIAKANDARSEYGDNVSENCIAGSAFIFLGAEPEDVQGLSNGTAADAARDLKGVTFTKEAAEWLRKVQRVADGTSASFEGDTNTGVIGPTQWGTVFAVLVGAGAFNAINNTF